MMILLSWLFLVGFQEVPQELTVQEKFRVDFVRLDLVVLDRNNQPVTDLKASDFVLRENGKKIDLEFFEIQDFRQAFKNVDTPAIKVEQEKESALPSQPALVPQFIFAIDLEAQRVVEMRKTFTQLRRAIDNGQFPEQGQYMIYSMESGVLGDGFLDGVEKLRHELNLFEDRMTQRYEAELANRKRTNSDHVKGSGRASTGARNLAELGNAIVNCLFPIRDRSDVNPENLRDAQICIQDSVDTFIEDEELRVRRVIGEIEALTYRFQDVKGLKTLFFVSPGFSLQPGQQAGQMADAVVQRIRNRLQQVSFNSFATTSSLEKEFRKVTHACIRNRVVFHTMDIYSNANEIRFVPGELGQLRGLENLFRDYHRSLSVGLSILADESGGFHMRAPNLTDNLTKVVPRLKYSYVFGYTSPDGKPGKYRKIKIKCKKKGVKLHYRRGYFGASS